MYACACVHVCMYVRACMRACVRKLRKLTYFLSSWYLVLMSINTYASPIDKPVWIWTQSSGLSVPFGREQKIKQTKQNKKTKQNTNKKHFVCCACMHVCACACACACGACVCVSACVRAWCACIVACISVVRVRVALYCIQCLHSLASATAPQFCYTTHIKKKKKKKTKQKNWNRTTSLCVFSFRQTVNFPPEKETVRIDCGEERNIVGEKKRGKF